VIPGLPNIRTPALSRRLQCLLLTTRFPCLLVTRNLLFLLLQTPQFPQECQLPGVVIGMSVGETIVMADTVVLESCAPPPPTQAPVPGHIPWDLLFGVHFSFLSLPDVLGPTTTFLPWKTCPVMETNDFDEISCQILFSIMCDHFNCGADCFFPPGWILFLWCARLFLKSGYGALRSCGILCCHGHAVVSALMPLRTRIWETGRTFERCLLHQ